MRFSLHVDVDLGIVAYNFNLPHPGCNRHHQDAYILSRESLYISICHCYWGVDLLVGTGRENLPFDVQGGHPPKTPDKTVYHMGVNPKIMGKPTEASIFNRVFHYKPPFWGCSPYFWKHPYIPFGVDL